MVNTENRYKKPVNGSYNNQRYRNTKPVEYRSFFRFLISPSGKISRDLFVGLRTVMLLIVMMLSFAFSFIPETNKYLVQVSTIVTYIMIWLTVAVGYKRAHALGISGFYSIIGTAFAKPFFEFNKQDNDYIIENIKTPLKRLRKFGNFVNRNFWTKIAYLIISYAVMFGFMVLATNKQGIKAFEILKFVGIFAGVNLAQLLLVKVKLFRHFYMQIVKVCIFFLYHIIFMGMIVINMQNSCIKTCLNLYQSMELQQETTQKQVQKPVAKQTKNITKK